MLLIYTIQFIMAFPRVSICIMFCSSQHIGMKEIAYAANGSQPAKSLTHASMLSHTAKLQLDSWQDALRPYHCVLDCVFALPTHSQPSCS